MIHKIKQSFLFYRDSSDDYSIKKVFPYNKQIFTQGLLKFNNYLIVSSGHYKNSFIAKLDLMNNEIKQCNFLKEMFFGESITFNGKYIVQLTWKENVVLCRDPDTLNIKKVFFKPGEGWGICCGDNRLFISDGSDTIKLFDKNTFQLIDAVHVFYQKEKIFGINDLEYNNGYIYANVLNTSYIIRIKSLTGEIDKIYDFKSLLKYFGKDIGILNGIAFVSKNDFLITGKNWNNIVLVELK